MLLQVEDLQQGMLSDCHMGFIFLESDFNVLKALNNKKNGFEESGFQRRK